MFLQWRETHAGSVDIFWGSARKLKSPALCLSVSYEPRIHGCRHESRRRPPNLHELCSEHCFTRNAPAHIRRLETPKQKKKFMDIPRNLRNSSAPDVKVSSFLLCASSSSPFSSFCFLPTSPESTNYKNKHCTTLNTTLYTTSPEADLQSRLHNSCTTPGLFSTRCFFDKKNSSINTQRNSSTIQELS